MSNNWKTVNIKYDKKNNVIHFPIESKEVLPAFLHYLLEYHRLPENAIMAFTDQEVRLIKKDQEYIYRRVTNARK